MRSVDRVEELEDYDAVVFGAPFTIWLFSVGSFRDTERVIGPLTHHEPKGIAQIHADLRPREYRVFRGVIQKHQWPSGSGSDRGAAVATTD